MSLQHVIKWGSHRLGQMFKWEREIVQVPKDAQILIKNPVFDLLNEKKAKLICKFLFKVEKMQNEK